MKTLNSSTILFFLLSLSFTLPASASDSCVYLFVESSIHESKFTLNEEDILAGPDAEFPPLEAVTNTGELFRKFLEKSPIKFLPAGSRFAVNLSRFNQVHVVSEGLTSDQHTQLMTFLMMSHAKKIFMAVPMLFRNRYMEVTIHAFGAGTTSVSVNPKLAVDLQIPITSQVITGFATKSSDKIRTYQPLVKNPNEKTRPDLLRQRFTQDTFATCGLASAIKIFNSRKVKYSESDLLSIVESSGIRSIKDIF